jgi:hypothetical protein
MQTVGQLFPDNKAFDHVKKAIFSEQKAWKTAFFNFERVREHRSAADSTTAVSHWSQQSIPTQAAFCLRGGAQGAVIAEYEVELFLELVPKKISEEKGNVNNRS